MMIVCFDDLIHHMPPNDMLALVEAIPSPITDDMAWFSLEVCCTTCWILCRSTRTPRRLLHTKLSWMAVLASAG